MPCVLSFNENVYNLTLSRNVGKICVVRYSIDVLDFLPR